MARRIEIQQNLQVIKDQVMKLASTVGHPVRLVAVSKTKPIEDIMNAYELGQRHFGENYVCILPRVMFPPSTFDIFTQVQELVEKSQAVGPHVSFYQRWEGFLVDSYLVISNGIL